MKRPPLHRLTNGTWIELSAISQMDVRMSEERSAQTGDIIKRPALRVMGPYLNSWIYFKTLKSAQACADELASIRNSYDLES